MSLRGAEAPAERAASDQRNGPAAESLFTEALTYYPGSQRTDHFLGCFYLETGRPERVAQVCCSRPFRPRTSCTLSIPS